MNLLRLCPTPQGKTNQYLLLKTNLHCFRKLHKKLYKKTYQVSPKK